MVFFNHRAIYLKVSPLTMLVARIVIETLFNTAVFFDFNTVSLLFVISVDSYLDEAAWPNPDHYTVLDLASLVVFALPPPFEELLFIKRSESTIRVYLRENFTKIGLSESYQTLN